MQQKKTNIKKSILTTTNSLDNFSLNKNTYQRKESQESNSKLSSSISGKDKKYKSFRYSKIKNILKEKKYSSLIPKKEEQIIKTEIEEKIDTNKLNQKEEETEEKEEISNEEIVDVKRKSGVFKFKYLNTKKDKKEKKRSKYEEQEEEKEQVKKINLTEKKCVRKKKQK